MSDQSRTARRYHWLSQSVTSFVNEPHESHLFRTSRADAESCRRRARAASIRLGGARRWIT
jgi:hypothetical protein